MFLTDHVSFRLHHHTPEINDIQGPESVSVKQINLLKDRNHPKIFKNAVHTSSEIYRIAITNVF
jgi:hypothetical protein